jgi:hypothetical protein
MDLDELDPPPFTTRANVAPRSRCDAHWGIDAYLAQQAVADVRAALPEGETCTDEEALAFLAAQGAKLGEEPPWKAPR